LCMAAAVNVAVTRTCIATTLILAFLSGEQNAISGILAASLVSLFVTGYMPFIATQVSRVDLETSLYSSAMHAGCNDGDSESGETEALTPFSDVHKHVDKNDNDEEEEDDDDDGGISMQYDRV
jgi:hypothetical protein